ncbi:MAG: biotin/lipoate A/B protein ligase family protein [Myxococcota bacterium]
MSRRTIRILRESFAPRAVFDTAVSRALLGQVARGRAPESLRLYSPGEVLAFSLLDRRQPGFAAALEHVRKRSFEPVLRLTGGRAAAFHRATLGFGWCIPIPDARAGIHERFDEIGSIIQATLTRLGVDARVGEVPGEYCPGDHSVNARGLRKLMGVGQRVVLGAAYVGGVLVVSDAERVREILQPVYRALDTPFDPSTVGSIAEEIGEISLEEVAAALLEELSRRYELASGAFDAPTLRLAGELEGRHRADAPKAPLAAGPAAGSTPSAKGVASARASADATSRVRGCRRAPRSR